MSMPFGRQLVFRILEHLRYIKLNHFFTHQLQHVLGTQKNCFSEMVLLSTYNICLGFRNTKNNFWLRVTVLYLFDAELLKTKKSECIYNHVLHMSSCFHVSFNRHLHSIIIITANS